MSPSRSSRARRLLADLAASSTRPTAIARVRRKAGSRVAGSAVARPAKAAAPKPAEVLVRGRRPAWYVGAWGRLAAAIAGQNALLDPVPPHPDAGGELVKTARRHRGQAAFAEALGGGPLAARRHLPGGLRRSPPCASSRPPGPSPRPCSGCREPARPEPPGTRCSCTAAASWAGPGSGCGRSRTPSCWRPCRWRRSTARSPPEPAAAGPGPARWRCRTGRRRRAASTSRVASSPSASANEPPRWWPSCAGRPDRRPRRARRHGGLIEGWLDRRTVDVPGGARAGRHHRLPDAGPRPDVGQPRRLRPDPRAARQPGPARDVTFTGERRSRRARDRAAGAGPAGPPAAGRRRIGAPPRRWTVTSAAAEIPEGTWMVAFGWHMHPLFDLRYDFPYHPNIRPLFISFHVNRLDMLTDEAQAYLRRYGPVGCRDWNTVFLLLSAGIDAFFSRLPHDDRRCLFPAREAVYAVGARWAHRPPRRRAGKALPNVRVYSHQSDDYRYMSGTDGMRARRRPAGATSGTWSGRSPAGCTPTCRSPRSGVPVEFRTGQPGRRAVRRPDGLTPGDPASPRSARGIRDLIAAVFASDAWRAPDEDEVLRALARADRATGGRGKARFEAPVVVPDDHRRGRGRRHGRAGEPAIRAARRRGPGRSPTSCSLRPEPAPGRPRSWSSRSSRTRPGRCGCWVLGRGLGDDYVDVAGAAFPRVPITFLPCDQITYDGGPGRRAGSRRGSRCSTMDRLLAAAPARRRRPRSSTSTSTR